MLTNGKIKVKYIGEGEKGFVKGKVYDAYQMRSKIKNASDMICVVDDFGEEYAFPKKWFEIVEN